MEEQTLEIKFEGELVADCTWDDAGIDYTLYRVPGDVYVVLVTILRTARSRRTPGSTC